MLYSKEYPQEKTCFSNSSHSVAAEDQKLYEPKVTNLLCETRLIFTAYVSDATRFKRALLHVSEPREENIN